METEATGTPEPYPWKCSECGKPQVTGKAGFDDLKGLCYDCDEIQRYTPTRGQIADYADVPPAYRRLQFREPPVWPAELLRGGSLADWKGKPWSVVLTGDAGAGKTTLATELFYRAAVSGMRPDGCLWIRASQLSAALDGPDRERWRIRANEARVAVFDDLGREFSSGGILRVVEILATRFDYQRPTIVTTNMPFVGRGGIDQLDAGLFRRLSEGYLVEMTGSWKP